MFTLRPAHLLTHPMFVWATALKLSSPGARFEPAAVLPNCWAWQGLLPNGLDAAPAGHEVAA